MEKYYGEHESFKKKRKKRKPSSQPHGSSNYCNKPKKVTLETLDERLEKLECIMSKISEFAAKQKAFNERYDAAVTGLTSDVAELNRKIEELQNTPGEITAEDQALLDELETRGDAISTKLEALDAVTPPAPPVE